MEYRVATIEDAPALARFAARLFVESYEHVMDRLELEEYVTHELTPAKFTAELQSGRITTFLALDPDILGYAQLAAGNRPDCALDAAAPAELKRIYVDHRLHGRGVARELVALVEEEGRRRGCDVLWLAVWEINDRAIAFYRKCGFRIIGRQGFPIGNEVQTDHVMSKFLADELR